MNLVTWLALSTLLSLSLSLIAAWHGYWRGRLREYKDALKEYQDGLKEGSRLFKEGLDEGWSERWTELKSLSLKTKPPETE